MDLNGAFHSRDWRESSYEPLRKIAATVERDELGHSEMGHYFLAEIASDRKGKALCQHLLGKWYPAALDMFGRSGSSRPTSASTGASSSLGSLDASEPVAEVADGDLEARRPGNRGHSGVELDRAPRRDGRGHERDATCEHLA